MLILAQANTGTDSRTVHAGTPIKYEHADGGSEADDTELELNHNKPGNADELLSVASFVHLRRARRCLSRSEGNHE